MTSFQNAIKFSLIPVFIISITACSAEDIAELLGVKIDADNAADVARAALDMAEVSDLAEEVTGLVAGTGPDINETINCADVPGVTGSGTAAVVGTTGVAGDDLTVTYNSCTMNGFTLNGSLNVTASTTGDIETETVSGNLTVGEGNTGKSFSIKNYSMLSTKDKVVGDYTKDFGMTVTLPILGDIVLDTPTPFSGNNVANLTDKPETGVMTVTGSSSAVELTAEGNSTGYSLALDSNGDRIYETPVLNGTGTIFPW